MARHIKKPKVIKEKDLKDNKGPVVIDLDAPRQALDVEALTAVKAEEKYEKVIKAMEKAAASKQEASTVKTVSFNVWFQKTIAKNPKIKLSYKEALEAHCKSIGISQVATEEEFEAALTHFGV